MAKKRNYRVYLDDILESIYKIENYIENVSEADFEKNTQKQDAIIRRLEIIGEAVKHLPDSIKKKYPNVPWRQIAGMRDIVIHEYFGVSHSLIWKVATSDLVDLKIHIEKIIKELSN